MSAQRRITEPTELLNDNGELVQPGYATELHWRYDRSKIKAGWHRIKEWDYYYILNDKYGITFTMSDLGFAALIAVAWLDFERGTFTQGDSIRFLTKGNMNFPPTSDEGDVEFRDKKLTLGYYIGPGKRTIRVEYPEFTNSLGEKGLSGELVLQQPVMDTMVIASSWKGKPKKFYYNQKINCMPAEGTIRIGDTEYKFTPDCSFGGLDWGRGNWTYKNRWFWGSASGLLEGEPFGWNVGYGFSDRSSASENMIFYKGKAHKLDEVTFQMDTDDYMKQWKLTSNDGRFEMDFEPIVDRLGKFNLLLIKSVQHQVFGWHTGKIVLDDGTELKVDRFLGFAEDVYNRY